MAEFELIFVDCMSMIHFSGITNTIPDPADVWLGVETTLVTRELGFAADEALPDGFAGDCIDKTRTELGSLELTCEFGGFEPFGTSTAFLTGVQ